jgi:hypothetical protein
MSKIALSGNASGTGTFTIASPNSSTDRTLDLPDAAGTIQVSGNPISGTTGTFTGLVDISAAGAGQIQFPATQNASANANTLDDYEEGTWTPVIYAGATALTATNVGVYTKIGRQVTVSCSISNINKGVATGNLTIEGLPFTSLSTGPEYNGAVQVNRFGRPADTDGLVVNLNPNSTVLVPLANKTNDLNAVNLTDTQILNTTSDFYTTVTYFTS